MLLTPCQTCGSNPQDGHDHAGECVYCAHVHEPIHCCDCGGPATGYGRFANLYIECELTDGDSGLIARVFRGKTCEADARLIAAAPDLLEACKRLYDTVERLTDDATRSDTVDADLEFADAAIDKATGVGVEA